MFWQQGIPADVDAETHLRIARTFFVFRMVRGGLLLAFLVAILMLVDAKGWPHTVAAIVGLGVLVEVWVLVRSAQRFTSLRATTRPPE
jgi:hypothetical protein